jgi:hypothetical protein
MDEFQNSHTIFLRYCTAFFSLRGGFLAHGISRRVGVRLPGSFVSLEGFWCFKGSWRDETDDERTRSLNFALDHFE